MRRSVQCSVCALLIPVLQAISGAVPTERWQKFSSSVAGFSILMPGEAQESVGSPPFGVSYGDVRSYFAEVGLDEGSFAVAEHVFAEEIDTTKNLSAHFDRFQETAARNLGGKIISQRDVSIGGMPARRISLVSAVPGLTYTVDEVFIIKGNRLFRLSAMDGAKGLSSDDIDKFFDSFSITGPAKEWKRSRSDPKKVVEKDDPELGSGGSDELSSPRGVVGAIPGGPPPSEPSTLAGILSSGPPHVRVADPTRLRVAQGVMRSSLVTKVNPIYPPEAKRQRIDGAVLLQINIDKNGNVSEVEPISGHPLLIRAAIDAVKQWKYKPYLLNNTPIEVETTVLIKFVISEDNSYSVFAFADTSVGGWHKSV